MYHRTLTSALQVNIHAYDITKCVEAQKEYLVLGMVWQIIKIQLLSTINIKETPELVVLLKDEEELKDLLALPPEDILLRWFNYHLEKAGTDRRVKNFTNDLKDAKNYVYLLNQIDANAMGLAPLELSDAKDRAREVIKGAKAIDVPAIIQPKDIVQGNRNLNLAFVAQIFNTNNGLKMSEEEEKLIEQAGILEDDTVSGR